MGKKKQRRAVPSEAAPAVVDESNAWVGEEEMLRDEIDSALLERDVIRFEGDSDRSTDDEDLQTEEILELPSEEEDSEEDELRERDFEEVEDELRVTDKAWGKKKSIYYNEDEEEDDISSAEEEEMEEEEEREAMVLQERLMSHLTAQDFETSRFITDSSDTAGKETIIKTDFSSMSKDEKLMHLLKNSPELPEMVDEFREKLSEAKEPLYPLLEMGRQKGTFSDTGHSYIEAKYKLNLLYCLNIGYYLMLHTQSDDVKNHPVVERIVEMRKMYQTCAKTDCTLEKEIEHLLNAEGGEEDEGNRKRKLSASHDGEDEIEEEEKGKEEEEDMYEKHKKINEEKKRKKKKKKGIEVLPEDPTLMEEGEDKRGITYKIMKNKGLTPHRKKEQRNPRVKHRKKFDKALKKRRSQVPDYRKQEGAYGGEKSGIKSGLTKSTVLK